MNNYQYAQDLVSYGLCALPAKDKRPVHKWKDYQGILPDVANLRTSYLQNLQIFIVCGAVSGNVEVIDVDEKHDPEKKIFLRYKFLVETNYPDLWSRLVIEKTQSGGYHIIYRCSMVGENQKLAKRADGETLIETRGEGGGIVCAPSPGYRLLKGNFANIPKITIEERVYLLNVAKSLNQKIDEHRQTTETEAEYTRLTPLDDYNQRGPVIDLLEKHGWKVSNTAGEAYYLKRPNGGSHEHHATYNYIPGIFYCFSTSTSFINEKAYYASAVYAELEHKGDFKAAAKALYRQGYGERLVTEEQEKVFEEPDYSNTPTIPIAVYEALPPLLAKACQAFTTDREKDVFLTAAISVLSGCFPTVSGIYARSTVRANLYSFIVAPAASGKGAMTWAKSLGIGYHKMIRAETDRKWSIYDAEFAQWNADKKNNPVAVEPTPPPFKMLFFPANTSAASFMQNLKESDGKGIMFESEADTLSGALSQDWGNFSETLRKAFHHETATQNRKGNSKRPQLIEIEHPQLSVCLSGTPAQVKRLIPNVEDGLFSRFIFYGFSVVPTWMDVSPYAGRVNLNDHFTILENQALQMIETASCTDVKFDLTRQQWERLNNDFSKWLTQTADVVPDAVSSVKRLGLIAFRITMLLTILRQLEQATLKGYMICEEIDFITALTLVDVYRAHALQMLASVGYNNNATTNRYTQRAEQVQQAKELNAQGFSLGEIAEILKVPKSTVQYWLKQTV